MTPHLPAILAAMLLVWLPLILAYVALRALWRRWTYRPERLRNAHYLVYGGSLR